MNKYSAVKTKIDGYDFDSKAEGRRYLDLCLLVRAGEITNLQVHPVYILQEAFEYHGKKLQAIKYEGDFYYWENGKEVIEDVKGGRATQTDLFKVKAKMFKKNYPNIDFRIVEA